MKIEEPHRGRRYQRIELGNRLLLDNPECALDETLFHHFLVIGVNVVEVN